MSESRYASIFFVLLLGLSLLLLTICSFIQVDNFDAFNLLLNAKAIANQGGAYSIYRSIVGSVFFAPAFLIERLTGREFIGFRIAHIMNGFLFAFILYSMYRLYRLHLNKLSSLVAVFGFAFLPIVIHYVPIAKEDLPGCLFVILSFHFYIRTESSKDLRPYFLCSIFTALAIGCRYNLIPVLFLCYAVNELCFWRERRSHGNHSFLKPLFFLFFLPLLLWILFPSFVYPLVHIAKPTSAPIEFIKELFTQYQQNLHVYKAPIYTFRFLWKALSLPLFLFVGLGLLSNLNRVRNGSRIHLIWFSVFFIFHSYFVPGKEVRYLFPCLPPLFFFFALGLESCKKFRWQRHAYGAALLLVGLLLPFHRGMKECAKFLDPFYWTPFEKQVSLQAKQLAGENSILWFGNFYGTHPKDYIFDLADDFTYLYHFYVHTIHFYTGRPTLTVEGGKTVIPQEWQTQGILLPNLGTQMQDGDVVLVNLERTVSRTSYVPKPVPPLVMQRVRKHYLSKTGSDQSEPSLGKTYELYTRNSSEAPYQSRGFYQFSSTEEVKALLSLPFSDAFLLNYDSVKLFHPPNNS